jgi:flavin reductase (DIM6/NTAB) family NADH-FMN oxidoreductase RutF
MNDDTPRALDPGLFRRVMGSFVTGVTIISTETRGEVRGMTANAFMSGSLSPPLCVISVSKTARMHGYLVEAGHFGVSILARGQEHISAHFGGRPDANLQPAFRHIGRTPVLADAVATITTTLVGSHECGDHTVFIGSIEKLTAHGRAPLVVHGGRYASLNYSGEPIVMPVTDFW